MPLSAFSYVLVLASTALPAALEAKSFTHRLHAANVAKHRQRDYPVYVADDDINVNEILPPSVDIAMDSPCAPDTSSLLRAGLLEPKAPPEDIPPFFMYNSDVFNFSESVECLMEAVGSTREFDDLDLRVMPNIAEHLTDFRLMSHLAKHPARTWNESLAEFFIVGSAFGTSYHASRLEGSPCGNISDHHKRARKALDEMILLPTFQATPDRFVIIDTDWNWFSILPEDLVQDLIAKDVILATTDLVIADYGGIVPENVAVIPYKAHYVLEDAAFGQTLADQQSLSLLLTSQYTTRDEVVRGVRRGRTISVALPSEGDVSNASLSSLSGSEGTQRRGGAEHKETHVPAPGADVSSSTLSGAEGLQRLSGAGHKGTQVAAAGANVSSTNLSGAEGPHRPSGAEHRETQVPAPGASVTSLASKSAPTGASVTSLAIKSTPTRASATLVASKTSQLPQFHADGSGDSHSAETRDVSFTFHGLMGRRNGGSFRFYMRQMSAMLPDTSVQDVSFYNYTADSFPQIAMGTAQTLLRSQFCFVPAGDTPSSRRLFDALAAGCVPIIFNDVDVASQNLPFRHTVEWPKIAIFTGDADCVAEKIASTVFWLQQLLESKGHTAWTVEVMRENGRQAFRDHLSYRSKGIASAFLLELRALRAP